MPSPRARARPVPRSISAACRKPHRQRSSKPPTASQHGGQETTLFSIITNLLHFGLTIVGLDYGYPGQQGVKEVHGSSPYGATTIADGDGSRQPSDVDLGGARYQGRRVAEVAAKLFG